MTLPINSTGPVGRAETFLPNTAGPIQRAMAADAAARRARLFNASPPPKAIVRPRRVEHEIAEAVAVAIIEHPTPMPAWKAVLLDVSSKYGIPVSMIVGDSRSRSILPARYEAAYRMVHELGMSLLATGRRINRDHTSVLHAINRHVATHPELKAAIDAKRAERRSVRVSMDDEIIRLYFADGKSVKAIAEELDVSRPSVHALVHREVMRVRKAMAE